MQPERTGDGLTPAEVTCLDLSANGYTVDAIAEHMELPASQVEELLQQAVDKLETENRLHAIIKATRLGIISAR